MIVPRPAHLRHGVLIPYALPAIVFALPTIPVYIYLPALYGDHLGLGLTTVGLVLLCARIFDTVTDPIVGYLSDRIGFKGAHRKPWIIVGALIAGFALFKVLSPPTIVSAEYLLIWSIILYGGWTMIAIPYVAWGAELSIEYTERTRVTAWREGMGLIGIVGAAGLGTLATSGRLGELSETKVIALAAIVLGVALLPLMVWRVPDRQITIQTESKGRPRVSVSRQIQSLLQNKLFVRLLSVWLVNGIANGIPAALFFLYLKHGLGVNEDARSGFVLVYFIAAILAIPFWAVLSKRMGKHRTWCIAMGAACGGFSIVPFLAPGAVDAFAVVCIITGMSLGADLILPPAIQADVVDYDRLKNGSARTGQLFSLWAMATKLALALSVGTALPLLEGMGFDAANPTERGRIALTVIYAGLPVVIKVIAIGAIWSFPLNARKHAIIRRRLETRRNI